MKILFQIFCLSLSFSPVISFAEDLGDQAKHAVQATERAAKKTGREIQDKTCELVNGKMECAAKKLKHKAQNTVDKVKDAAENATH